MREMTILQTLSPEQLRLLTPAEKLELEEAALREILPPAKTDPAAFIDLLCWTFNPKVREGSPHLPFRLFEFQRKLVEDLVYAIEGGYDIFIDKCREMGATYTTLAVLLWYWDYIEGSNFLVGSRKQDFVDNTMASASAAVSNKEESLFGKMEYMIKRLPWQALPAGFDLTIHKTFMSLANPELGNIIGGESSNPNFSRGGRQKAILLDEFAFWDNDNSAWGSTADTTNCRIILTTPGIRPNTKAKRLREGRDAEEIKIVSLTYNLDPRKTDAWLAEQRKRRSSDDFAREIMINWEGSILGIVYPEMGQALIGDYPYLPAEGLYFTWDFGLDGLAIQAWQWSPLSARLRLVDAYENVNKPIPFFFPWVGQPIDSQWAYTPDDIKAIERFKLFKKAIHFGDPDVSKRSILTGTSTRQALEAVQVYVQTNPAANDFATRREATKVMLQQGIEVNETPGTNHWLDCMKGARYPQRAETSQATNEITKPIHDWTSHNRTATEYFAVNYEHPSAEVSSYHKSSYRRSR